MSVGGVHFLLNALIEKGCIKLGNFTAAEDKRRHAYILTQKGIATRIARTRAFLARKREEYDAIRKEIQLLEHQLGTKEHGGATPDEA